MTTAGAMPTTRWTMMAAGVVFGLCGCPSDPGPTPTDTGGRTDATDVPIGMDAGPDVPGTDVQPDRVIQPDNPVPVDATDVLVPTDVRPDAPMPGMPISRLVAACGMSCNRPLDAIPDTMGTTIFFTAFNPMGEAAVFRVPAAGGAITQVAAGNGLEFPLGITISNDGATLYVADQSADRGMQEGAGAIFSIPAAGGMPTVIPVGTELIQPAAITITSDGMALLISARRTVATGIDRALFRVGVGGGTATVVNSDLVDPSGVSQAPDGTIICHDTRRGGENSATAVRIGGMISEPVAGSLVAGYPAGLAFSTDGSNILLSGADPSGLGGLLTWSAGRSAPVAPPALSTDMVAPQGLHRARSADLWAVADEQAMGNGAIFVVRAAP